MSGFVGITALFSVLQQVLSIDYALLCKHKNESVTALSPLSDKNRYTITRENIKKCIEKLPNSFYEKCAIADKAKFQHFVINYLVDNIKDMI